MPTEDHIVPKVQYYILEDARFRVGTDSSVWSRATHNGFIRRDGRWRQLKTQRRKDGYYSVKLGRWKRARLHRLILESFGGPCPEGMECRHLDGDRSNNVLNNLAWGTRSENRADQVLHGTAHWTDAFHKQRLRETQPIATQKSAELAKLSRGD